MVTNQNFSNAFCESSNVVEHISQDIVSAHVVERNELSITKFYLCNFLNIFAEKEVINQISRYCGT